MRFVICCLALLTLAVPTHAKSDNGWISGKVYAFAPNNDVEATVEVKPLDHPNNPYRDQYSDFDRWTYANYSRNVTQANIPDWQRGLSRAQGFHPLIGWPFLSLDPVEYSTGLAMAAGSVDVNGYVIPAFNSIAEVEQSHGHVPKSLRAEMENASQPSVRQHAIFWALGRWNASVEQACNDVRDRYFAAAYPALPEWLVALQSDIVLLPDGGAVAIQETSGAKKSIAQRYSADGTMMREAPMSDWFDWHSALSMLDPKLSPNYKMNEVPIFPGVAVETIDNIENVGGRYDVLLAPDRKQVLSVIDYWQGKEFSLATDPKVLDTLLVEWQYFRRVEGKRIQLIYAAQQRVGAPVPSQ